MELLSRFPGNRTGGYRWSKKKSASPCRELRVETGNGEFQQTPRGRYSPTLVIFYLKGCVVVSYPKGMFGCILNQGKLPYFLSYALAGI